MRFKHLPEPDSPPKILDYVSTLCQLYRRWPASSLFNVHVIFLPTHTLINPCFAQRNDIYFKCWYQWARKQISSKMSRVSTFSQHSAIPRTGLSQRPGTALTSPLERCVLNQGSFADGLRLLLLPHSEQSWQTWYHSGVLLKFGLRYNEGRRGQHIYAPPKQQEVTFNAVGNTSWKSTTPSLSNRTIRDPPHLRLGVSNCIQDDTPSLPCTPDASSFVDTETIAVRLLGESLFYGVHKDTPITQFSVIVVIGIYFVDQWISEIAIRWQVILLKLNQENRRSQGLLIGAPA